MVQKKKWGDIDFFGGFRFPMENEEFKLLMKARQNVYDLLRCFFLQEPTKNFLAAFKEENILKDLMGFDNDLDEGVELIASALSSPDLAELSSALAEEFTRLFVGPLPIPCMNQFIGPNRGWSTRRKPQPSGENTRRPDFLSIPKVPSRKTTSAPSSNSYFSFVRRQLSPKRKRSRNPSPGCSRSFCGTTCPSGSPLFATGCFPPLVLPTSRE